MRPEPVIAGKVACPGWQLRHFSHETEFLSHGSVTRRRQKVHVPCSVREFARLPPSRIAVSVGAVRLRRTGKLVSERRRVWERALVLNVLLSHGDAGNTRHLCQLRLPAHN